MTMQVGMVGSDGIVLASDTKWHQNDGDAVWQAWGSPKIAVNPSGSIAVACAKDMRKGIDMARAIFEQLGSEYWEKPELKLEEISESRSSRHSPHEAECLIGLAFPTPRIFHLACGCSESAALCTPILDRRAAGDALNSALFWHMRYYTVKPVRELIRLAAQIIVDAAEISNGGIGGLQIAYTDGSGFRFVSEDRKNAVEAEAKRRGTRIGRIIFKMSKSPADNPIPDPTLEAFHDLLDKAATTAVPVSPPAPKGKPASSSVLQAEKTLDA
jgi:hypothetical protein